MLSLNEFKKIKLSKLRDITGGECNTCDLITGKDDITTVDPDSPEGDNSECVGGKDKVPTEQFQ